MRRLGEAASDVAGGQQSPKSPTRYAATGRSEGKSEGNAGRANAQGRWSLAPAGEIECGANFTRDTATDSSHPPSQLALILSRALRSSAVRSARTNERLFSPSFPLIAESQAPVIPRSSPRGVPSRVFFFSYRRRFHKYSMADDAVPRDCETSGRFRPVPGTFAPLNRIRTRIDVSLARSPEYSPTENIAV